VSAILVIAADKGKPQYTLIGVIPTFLFLVLDTYYLSLEKRFRGSCHTTCLSRSCIKGNWLRVTFMLYRLAERVLEVSAYPWGRFLFGRFI
jgi:hypothetical protein